jgi:hypothetical protein
LKKIRFYGIFFIKGKVNTLKNISTAMQNELDDQAILLDDLGREMDTADTKMQTVMKKLTKILHMSSGINKQNFFYNDI